MTDRPTVLRLSAFAADPTGGNPAGVVLDAASLGESDMQTIAAEIGFAETAFVIGSDVSSGERRHRIRYFSPIAEVPFCGHATVATAVALAERDGMGAIAFDTPVGEVLIETRHRDGIVWASFTSVPPWVGPIDDDVLDRLLRLLGVGRSDLRSDLPPRIAFAGNRHPVIVFSDAATFDGFAFDPGAVRELMDEQGWLGTVTTAVELERGTFETRNLFPVGAITEDPATGSAAAALGAYVREFGAIDVPGRLVVHQGRQVGRPSVLLVDVPIGGGIVVTGSATTIPRTERRT
jgi:PhzF family phenazine biosynthesis protein